MKAERRYGGTAVGSRREFLASVAAALLTPLPPYRPTAQDSLPGTGPSGRLWDPSRAGRPLPPVAAADNDAAIQAIEKQIHCTCGCNLDVYTCRTTDFTCTVSPAMHQQVVALAKQGKTGEQILDQFVREHGVAILMAPPKRGFNWLGYLLPSVLIVVTGTVLTIMLRHWILAAPAPHPSAPAPSSPPATPEELERLRRELDHLSA